MLGYFVCGVVVGFLAGLVVMAALSMSKDDAHLAAPHADPVE